MKESLSVHRVTALQLEDQLLKTITCLRLPFQTVENPAFQSLLNLIYSGHGVLELPSAKTLRRRLRDAVTNQQELQLQDLPEDAKVSLALDCWTSPFQQAFMAITVYFIDKGANLIDVLHQLLKERRLLDRIFSVTTDDATNNETLIRALQEKLISTGTIGSRESIVRVPCMAHVIQLCLKQLLGHIRAAPKNKEVRAFWSDTQAIGLRDSANNGEVAHVLTKIRSFAVFVNASPQRRDAFLCLQSGGARLFPLHDVQTRWNSTFLMLRRARRLRNIIDKYCRDHEYPQFKITDVEWRQIDYLVDLTKPFFQFTMALMKTKDVTIHSVFLVYRKLLEHIERSNQKLKKKTTPWKKDMYGALLVAKQKLKEYYEKTYRDHGFLYGTGTLLAPQYKLAVFDDREYSTCHDGTSKRYCEYLRTCFMQYQQQNPEMLFRTVQRPSLLHSSELDRLLQPLHAGMVNEGAEHDEVDRYLREPNVPVPPRVYWREHEREFPVLSRLARDLLSVPATGAGVERLFNSARDICHYRRGSLHETTIQDLMMYMCSEKFTLEEQQLSRMEKPIESEGQEELEEDEALKADDVALISDDEEVEESEDAAGNIATKVRSQAEGMLAESDRPSTHSQTYDVEGQEEEVEVEEDEDDEADLLPPPITQLGDRSQKRSSDISPDLRNALVDEYANEKPPTDGEVYRKIRQYQHGSNALFQSRWWSRLSPIKAKRLRRLTSPDNAYLCAAFDALLAIPGLWNGMSLGSLNTVMALKCDEEVIHYLKHVKNFWATLVNHDRAQMARIDRRTVDTLQSYAPRASTVDRKIVKGKILGGEVFSNFSGSERVAIWESLRSHETCDGIIPSLHTFFRDVLYLEVCANALKRLVTLNKQHPTIRRALVHSFRPGRPADTACLIQASESTFRRQPGSNDERLSLAYRQIWMYAMRHYPDMAKNIRDGHATNPTRAKARAKADESVIHDMATLARKLGFRTTQINAIIHEAFESLIEQIAGCFACAILNEGPPMTLTAGRAMKLKDRYGIPPEYAQPLDRPYIFLDRLYSATTMQRNLSSLEVRRSVYYAFIGKPSSQTFMPYTPPAWSSASEPSSPLFVPRNNTHATEPFAEDMSISGLSEGSSNSRQRLSETREDQPEERRQGQQPSRPPTEMHSSS
ncbi:hypothetical protein N7492_009754 [Penicillium capsulatum]|uniref:HAT C-terminal dimerisation domain-containing protein n=1 Tax=Penicillium capsulatum TaxID=69766 RepID=A0A9W9HS19_9EURO|nr:hypothetical protein N7492_009754 [Penicillium capsulatum]